MLVMVLANAELAKRISEVVKGQVVYVVRVKDAIELHHKVYSHQPDILILDWSIGGSVYKATDQIPLIMERTSSKPHIICLLPWRSRAVDREAAKLGCYDVVSVNAKNFLRELGERISVAKASRAAGLPAVRKKEPPVLH